MRLYDWDWRYNVWWYNMWRTTPCERGCDGWYNMCWLNIRWSKSRVWDHRIGIDDIICEDLYLASVAGMHYITCDDLTYDDLNQECEIIGLGLMI